VTTWLFGNEVTQFEATTTGVYQFDGTSTVDGTVTKLDSGTLTIAELERRAIALFGTELGTCERATTTKLDWLGIERTWCDGSDDTHEAATTTNPVVGQFDGTTNEVTYEASFAGETLLFEQWRALTGRTTYEAGMDTESGMNDGLAGRTVMVPWVEITLPPEMM